MNLTTHQPPAFEHDPNRDASKTIRGFVYQADLTVQQWISLSPGEILLLEQGEDIDRVAAAVLAGEPHRIVEQVKSLERRVTLRSKATLEAVANFALHRDRNPGVRLRFRFITNAMIGKEQKVTFRGARKGIAAWSRLHETNLSKDERSALATTLRDFYRGLHQPKRFPNDAWTALHTLLQNASEGEWLDFLTGFEWTTGNVAPEMLPAQIRSDLVARGISADGVQAIAEPHRSRARSPRRLVYEDHGKAAARHLARHHSRDRIRNCGRR